MTAGPARTPGRVSAGRGVASVAAQAAGTYEPILDLQATAGNRAVSSALRRVAQREIAGDTVDPSYRTQRLREAISFQAFPMPQWRVDLGAARDALAGLTPEDGRRIKAEYQRQEGQNLAWIIAGVAEVNGVEVGNSLARADRVELGNLLRGTVMGAPATASPAEAARVSASRWNALAGQFKAALDRRKGDDAIELIPASAGERAMLEQAYVRLFGGSIQLAMMTSLGEEAPRAIASWAGATAIADRLALESAAAAKAKADAKTNKMAEAVSGIMGSSEELRRGVAKQRREAAEKLEAKVRRVRARENGAKHLEQVLGAAPGLAATVGVGHDPVMTALAAGNVGGELGAGLARRDREGDVSLAEAEAVIRQLRELADTAAETEINADADANEGRRDEITRRIAGQYYAAFERAYAAAGPRRPLRDLVSGTGGDKERALKVFGGDTGGVRGLIEGTADSARNRALLDARGDLPKWQDLFLALNRDTVDMDRVRAILDPLTRAQVDELAVQYTMHTGGRSLERDLVGTPLGQQAATWMLAGKERERQREGTVLLRGGRFDAAAADAALPPGLDAQARDAALVQAEGRFIFGRIADLERRVMENRGTFAYARDWAGNEEHALLGLARRDGTDAKGALEQALLRSDADGGPDVASARRQLLELRRVQFRLEHATTVYKAATQKAFDEFVDLAVNVTSFAAGLFPGGILITMLRTTAATVGTKLLLRGSEYTAQEFVADIEAGLVSGVGDLAKLPVEDLSVLAANKIAPLVTRLGVPASFSGQVRKHLGAAAIRQAEHTVSTAAQNVALGKGLGEGQGVGDRVTGEVKHHVGEAIKSMTGPHGEGAGGAADEEAAARKQLGAGAESSAGRGAHGDGEPAVVRPRDAGDTDAKPGADEDGGSAPVSMHLPDEAAAPPVAGALKDEGASGRLLTDEEIDTAVASLGKDDDGVPLGPARQPGHGPDPEATPSPSDVDKPISYDQLRDRYGMPESNTRRIEEILARHRAVAEIRPTSAHAANLLSQGLALPKPEKVKVGTLTEDDLKIGLGRPEDLGKAIVATERHRLRLPPYAGSLDESTRARLQQRIEIRDAERREHLPTLLGLQEKGLVRVMPSGLVVNRGLEADRGLPFTGDHDLFDLRRREGEPPLTRAEYQALVAELSQARVGVKHGAVAHWPEDSPESYNTPAGQAKYARMQEAARPGGSSPLVVLGDGTPRIAWRRP